MQRFTSRIPVFGSVNIKGQTSLLYDFVAEYRWLWFFLYPRISFRLDDLSLCFLLNNAIDNNIEILELLHDMET